MAVFINSARAGTPADTDHITKTSPKVMVNGDVIFTAVGDVQILSLLSECYTANNTTASTLQYSYTNTGTATSQTLCNATTTLASKPIGSVVSLAAGSSLAEAPTISANAAGAVVNTASRGVRVASGNVTTVIGIGSTTGTWVHYVRWEPLEEGAYILPAF